MERVHLECGIGAWSFSVVASFRRIPVVGDRLTATGNGFVYTVNDVVLTADGRVLVECPYRFESKEEVDEAREEWNALDDSR